MKGISLNYFIRNFVFVALISLLYFLPASCNRLSLSLLSTGDTFEKTYEPQYPNNDMPPSETDFSLTRSNLETVDTNIRPNDNYSGSLLNEVDDSENPPSITSTQKSNKSESPRARSHQSIFPESIHPIQSGLNKIYSPSLIKLVEKYKGKVIICHSDRYPHCEFILCGTIHVTNTSTEMVREVIEELKPQFIMLELCEARVDTLLESQEVQNITIFQVLKESYNNKSIRLLGMGLLSWMQLKAAKVLGSRLGNEQNMAAKIGCVVGSMLVLGDRLYDVTVQRIFDRLNLTEKLKFFFIFLWEILTMSVGKLKDYVKKSEDDSAFVENEIEKFGKYLPSLADTVINERDEYMAQTLCEIARVGFGPGPYYSRGRIVAVVGAGHITGLQKWLKFGGISPERLHNISISSRHAQSCWPGSGSLQIVNTQTLFPQTASTP